jgi:Protein of unknown function (DUF3072)
MTMNKGTAAERQGSITERDENTPNTDNLNMIKDPDDWKTGDEEMTGAQRSYLQTLADEAREEVDLNLTKAEASKKIDELQQRTGRGVDH